MHVKKTGVGDKLCSDLSPAPDGDVNHGIYNIKSTLFKNLSLIYISLLLLFLFLIFVRQKDPEILPQHLELCSFPFPILLQA